MKVGVTLAKLSILGIYNNLLIEAIKLRSIGLALISCVPILINLINPSKSWWSGMRRVCAFSNTYVYALNESCMFVCFSVLNLLTFSLCAFAHV